MTRNPRVGGHAADPGDPAGRRLGGDRAPDTSASHSSTRLDTGRPRQPLDDVVQALGPGGVGDGLPQGPVRVGEVAQQQPLRSPQPQPADVLGEGHRPLPHLPDDRLSESASSATHGCVWRYVASSADSSSASGFGQVTSSSSSIRSSYSRPSAFISATASPRALNCWASKTARGSSNVASTTETTSRVRRCGRVEHVDRAEGERGERLVEGEAELEVLDEPADASVGVGAVQPLDDAGRQERAVDLYRLPHVPNLPSRVLVVVPQQLSHGGEWIPLSRHDIEHHGVRDSHPRHEWLRWCRDQALEALLGPGDEAVRRLPALHLAQLLGVVARLGQVPRILDGVFRGLDDDVAGGVVPARPARPAI